MAARWNARRQASLYSRRAVLQYALAAGGVAAVAACSPGARAPARGVELAPLEGREVVLDPSKLPARFTESPTFAKLVQAGSLPPVTERIGAEPLVIKPVEQIGKYGGEIRRAYTSVGDEQNAHRFLAGPDSLLYWDKDWKKVVPNIARDYEMSADNTVLTLHLRKGMRWSDGAPFTADDIIFWREDISLNKDLSGGSPALRVLGQEVRIEKVDDYTVRYVSPTPNAVLPRLLASSSDIGGLTVNGKTGGGGYAPKHYLTRFHPKYTPQAEVDGAAHAAGVSSWTVFFLRQMNWALNTELPVLAPWRMVRPINSSPWTFEANPYSIWVDTEGQQLPYIHKVTMRDVANQEVLSLSAVAGEFDFQDRGLPLSSLPVLLSNEQRGNYKISPTTRTTSSATFCGRSISGGRSRSALTANR
jgi:peptide/nickel transport system substrate-binding protein